MMNRTIYLASKDHVNKGSWFGGCVLKQLGNLYTFHYTNGVKNIKSFKPFYGMERLDIVYESSVLFPMFQNRLMSKNRPEYNNLINWLGLDSETSSPLEVLALTGGVRATDSYEIFYGIDVDDKGYFEHVFFAHGVKCFDEKDTIDNLEKGEKLKLALDVQNEHDPHAVLIRKNEPAISLAYCPRYLSKNIHELLNNSPDNLSVKVELINKNAPKAYNLLCKITGNIHAVKGFTFMDSEEYKQYTIN